MTLLSIVVPTISARTHWLEQAREEIAQNTTAPYELLVYADRPTCGLVWQEGGEAAKGDYIFMSADDIFPMLGWDEAAIEACDKGQLPAPTIYNGDGSLQSCGGSWGNMEHQGAVTDFTRAPFMSREQWQKIEPMLPCHYWTDNWVTWKGLREGYPTIVTHGYKLIHHSAPEGRVDSRMHMDMQLFTRATKGQDVWSEESS